MEQPQNKTTVEALINAIKARPVLWSPDDPLFKVKKVVNKTWDEIQELLPQYEVEDLRRKWKNLKDSYRKEFKKSCKITSSFDGTEWYESPWQYYNSMSFMRNILLKSPEQKPLLLENVPDAPQLPADQNPVERNCVEQKPVKQKPVDQKPLERKPVEHKPATRKRAAPKPAAPKRAESEEVSSDSSSSSSSKESTHVIKKRNVAPYNKIRAEYLEIEKRKLKMLEDEIKRSQNNEGAAKSEDYHFLMSLMPQMEKLEPVQKLRVRNKINKIFIEELLSTHMDLDEDDSVKSEPIS
ncbi:proton pump-interactor BIP131-like [Ostrinia furnacalis]|uniref:proton pump-interactor BIP131-like n=1 Tax=Ostrinia furnacalis TaxID=93504 RepID=UPI001038D537|nr:proton pump-interactor BIP131-like [Ostrinia furnacalis]